MPVGAIIGSTVAAVGSSALSSSAASKASGRAAEAQSESQAQALAEQRRQYDATQKLLQPFVSAATPALAQQMAALGLSGPEAQQAYVTQQEQSPLFQAMARQGEEAILQQASATGGLRGGNVQGALGQFRPQLLNQFLEQQYGRLSGISTAGQNAAAGAGTLGQAASQNIGSLLQGQGQIAAGQALQQGQAQANLFGAIGQGVSGIANFAGSGGFGARYSPIQLGAPASSIGGNLSVMAPGAGSNMLSYPSVLTPAGSGFGY